MVVGGGWRKGKTAESRLKQKLQKQQETITKLEKKDFRKKTEKKLRTY